MPGYLTPMLTVNLTPIIMATDPHQARNALGRVNDALQNLLDGSEHALAQAPKVLDINTGNYADLALMRAMQLNNIELKYLIVHLRCVIAEALVSPPTASSQ